MKEHILRLLNFYTHFGEILIFLLSVLVMFITPYYWVNNVTAFNICAYIVFGIAVLIYINIVYRVSNFSKYIGDLNRLVLILVESVLLFAVVYLWLILFIKESSFNGIDKYKYLWKVTKEGYVCSTYFNTLLEAVFNCIHFSIVTAATVGYGDVYPTHWFTKLVVDSQIIYTFAIVIIGIGKFGESNKIDKNRRLLTSMVRNSVKRKGYY